MAEIAGYGTKIGYGDALAGPFTDIAEVVELSPPAYEADDIDTTHMQSVNKWRTYQAGLKEGGEVEVTIHFEKALYNILHGTLLGADKFYQISFADLITTASTLKFPGYLKRVGAVVELDGLATVALTIKVAGEPVFTAGT